jgi:hypothetical protein
LAGSATSAGPRDDPTDCSFLLSLGDFFVADLDVLLCGPLHRIYRSVMVVDWDRPLQHRRGSPHRLDGVDLYYDFDWYEVFPDERTQFKNGRSLAILVRRECPEGKTPALLLTTRDGVEERTVETETHFLVVLNLRRYLELATADAAASYFAHALGRGITRISQLQDLAARPDIIREVVEHELDIDHIAAWAAERTDRIEQLRAIAGRSDESSGAVDLPAALAALRALESLDPDVTSALESVLGLEMDRETRLRFLRTLTADQPGRYATSEVLGERIPDRLGDAREATNRYERLLSESSSTETDLQQFIEQQPWLLGLEYVRVRPRRQVPRGAMDFVLERHDGYHDLLELKSPGDPIIVAPDAVDGVTPSASDYSLSPALAQAIAQVHVYRDTLSADAETVDRLYGLRNTRDPRVIIVIGQVGPLPPHRSRVLREVNLSLHRVEVVPYDVLAERAKTILNNVELYLTSRSDAVAPLTDW